MTWWDKLKAIANREAAAVKEEVGRAGHTLDEALAKKEQELKATPAERVDMLLDEIAAQDAHFEEIEAKLRVEGAERSASAGLEPLASEEPLATPDRGRIRDKLTVKAIDAETSSAQMSHVVIIDGHVLATLRTAGVDAVVDDLLAEVMVIDAGRSGDDIVVRTPTLTDTDVADLVARVMADHLPSLAAPATEDPRDNSDGDHGDSAL